MVGADYASLEDRIDALLTKDPNKLAVYAGYKQYELTINGEVHQILAHTSVEYDGTLYSGEELYALLNGAYKNIRSANVKTV